MNYFADYKKYIVLPLEKEVTKEEFDPADYGTFYILTLSLNDSLIENWNEADKFEIETVKSIETVLEEFNRKQKGTYYLQFLELEADKPYFVLALACKAKVDSQEANERVSYIVEKIISNAFYIGQGWYKFIGQKGRIERKLFCFSFREYTR
jgi:hypothetical protein